MADALLNEYNVMFTYRLNQNPDNRPKETKKKTRGLKDNESEYNFKNYLNNEIKNMK